jgi:hypothetical protein
MSPDAGSGAERDVPLGLDELAAQETVRAWLLAHSSHWEVVHTDEETSMRLRVLLEFCEFSGRGPDEMVSWLFRETPEGPRIRLKRRRIVMAEIEAFEKERGGRTSGNLVRSFLIHNGIALTATPLR